MIGMSWNAGKCISETKEKFGGKEAVRVCFLGHQTNGKMGRGTCRLGVNEGEEHLNKEDPSSFIIEYERSNGRMFMFRLRERRSRVSTKSGEATRKEFSNNV